MSVFIKYSVLIVGLCIRVSSALAQCDERDSLWALSDKVGLQTVCAIKSENRYYCGLDCNGTADNAVFSCHDLRLQTTHYSLFAYALYDKRYQKLNKYIANTTIKTNEARDVVLDKMQKLYNNSYEDDLMAYHILGYELVDGDHYGYDSYGIKSFYDQTVYKRFLGIPIGNKKGTRYKVQWTRYLLVDSIVYCFNVTSTKTVDKEQKAKRLIKKYKKIFYGLISGIRVKED